MAGEGCAFMHAPPGFGDRAADHRLVRRVRGFDPPPGQRRLCQGRHPLSWRDLRSVRALPLRRCAADACENGLTTASISAHVPSFSGNCSMPRHKRARRRRNCSTRSTASRTPASSPFAARTRSAGIEQLKARNCITDVRGDVLRIGFGIYQDEGDVDRLVQPAGGIDVNADVDAGRGAAPSFSRCCCSPTSSISSTGRSSASSPADQGRPPPHRHPVRGS